MTKLVQEVFGLREPKPFKSKQSPDKAINADLMVGVELEIEHAGNVHDCQAAGGSFWVVTEDGSLRPRGSSWEFVSRPAPLGVALAEMRLLFQKLRLSDEVNYSDRTSVHVHTNVCNFTQEQLANVVLIYPVFEAMLFQYVNFHKKREEQGYCRDTNLYCIPWASCRLNKKMVNDIFNHPEKFHGGRAGWQKYTALNFLPISTQGTIEWRHMHGTNDMEKLTTWFNMIGAIMAYCRDNSYAAIVNTIKVMNDVSTYRRFFTDVMQNTLPYSEEYRRAMSEGIINAKYSLMDLETKKDKPEVISTTAATAPAANIDEALRILRARGLARAERMIRTGRDRPVDPLPRLDAIEAERRRVAEPDPLGDL